MTDGINTARVGTMYFGPLPDGAVSITQQTQAFFGQSWPTLVYLPYIAAFDLTVRHELGLQDTGDFVDLVGPHEFAHQWWGHRVGWQSYRDQWLGGLRGVHCGARPAVHGRPEEVQRVLGEVTALDRDEAAVRHGSQRRGRSHLRRLAPLHLPKPGPPRRR
jgi:hypothetical protein